MRIILFVFTLLLCLTANIYCQSYEWQRVFTHEYKYDIDVASNGYLYTCGGGVFRSTDDGNTWAWIGTPSGGERNMTIDHNDVIYTGKAGQWPGIYKSTDYGNSWSVCYNGYVATRSMYTTREGYIYLGDAYGLFMKSTDSGISWSVDTVNYYNDILSITTTSNGQIFICTDYGLIYTSTDYGDNWTELPSLGNLIWPAQTITADSNDYLYTSRSESGIGISTDYGLTWNIYDNFPSATSSSVVAVDSLQNIYFAYDRVYRSTDGGSTWANMLGPNWVQSILTVGEKIYLATYSGIYRYDPSIPVYVGNNYMPLYVGNSYQYYIETYDSMFPSHFTYSLRVDSISKDTLINNNTYYLYSTAAYSDWIRYSEEDKKIYTWVTDTEAVYMDFNKIQDEVYYQYNNILNLYCNATVQVGSTNLFSQNYNYKGWYYRSGSYPFQTNYWEYFAENLGIYEYGVSNRYGYSSVNIIMQSLFDSLGNRNDITNHYKPIIIVNPVTVIDTSRFNLLFEVDHYYNTNPFGAGGGVYFISSAKIESFYSKEDSIITVPTYNALYNSNLNWSVTRSLDTMLLQNGFKYNYRIKATDRGLIAETSYSPDSGYYQCVWDEGTGLAVENNLPREYSLSQNYPNPFNPSTSIQYAISNRQFVTLKIYDVLGKEIVSLVNEEKPAGNYETEFNASHLASGIYYCQLRAGDYVETKKMMLLK